MPTKPKDPLDPRGLIHESYVIEGISEAECRSIFLDWALGLALDADQPALLRALLDRYAPNHGDHPMTKVLREALQPAATPRRRGGRAARNGTSQAEAAAQGVPSGTDP